MANPIYPIVPESVPVTFVLLSYNQERFIKDAINAALSQDYELLEIIISDDCSTDDTFEIIEELAANYPGPHKCILNRNSENMGLIAHVNKVFEIASNNIVILAAGDDISLPERTRRIADHFAANPKATAVHSKVTIIDQAGQKIREWVPPVVKHQLKTLDMLGAPGIIIGATAAYRKSVLVTFGPIVEKNTYEDLVLGFRAQLMGGLLYIDEALVKYRAGIGLSARVTPKTYSERLLLRKNSIARQLSTARQRYADSKYIRSPELQSAIAQHVKALEMRELFHKSPLRLFIQLMKSRRHLAMHAFSAEMKYCLGVSAE